MAEGRRPGSWPSRPIASGWRTTRRPTPRRAAGTLGRRAFLASRTSRPCPSPSTPAAPALRGQEPPPSIPRPWASGWSGHWCAYGERRTCRRIGAEDARSVVFDTAPLRETLEILGAPEVELECPPTGPRPRSASVSAICTRRGVAAGELWPAEPDPSRGREIPSPWSRKALRVRGKLNDAAHAFPKGHRMHARSPAPIGPSPGLRRRRRSSPCRGSRLTLPVRAPRAGKTRPLRRAGDHAALKKRVLRRGKAGDRIEARSSRRAQVFITEEDDGTRVIRTSACGSSIASSALHHPRG